MEADTLLTNLLPLASNLLAILLVVGGALFVVYSLWPWWIDRDAEERQRRHEIALKSTEIDQQTAENVARIARTLSRPLTVILQEPDTQE